MEKFIADNMLGKIAKYLRMLGYNTIFPPPPKTDVLIKLAQQEDRVVLTRSSQLKQIDLANQLIFYLKATHFEPQFRKIYNYFDLYFNPDRTFTRCLQCNTPLKTVKKNMIIDQIPPQVKSNFDHFKKCETCFKIYWQGSHTDRMLDQLRQILNIDEDQYT